MTKYFPSSVIKRRVLRNFILGLLVIFAGLTLAACDAGNQQPARVAPTVPAPPPPPPPPPPAGPVTISGSITFDLVPSNPGTNGLNYNNITQAPARGVTVRAVNTTGTILDSDVTNSAGTYSVTVPGNTNVRIQALSQFSQTTGGSRSIDVRDNTNGDAIYVLSGSLTSSGTANSTRNLNAQSGWGGASYTGTRAAAPFAILNSLFTAVGAFVAVDNNVDMPHLQILWSVNNTTADGDIADGDIGTSFYSVISNIPSIVLLGAANNDTDEYDQHVIVHEFGHYFEDQLARSDSIGGPHGQGDILNPTVAFSEGFGNALSAIALGDPIYRDSLGPSQNSGFNFNMENNSNANSGWFNEFSVHSIIYDIFDSADDGADIISAGLSPIYIALTNSDFTDDPAFTTIFTFLNSLRNNSTISNTNLTALINAQSINGTGSEGAGETNNGGIATALPLYQTVTVGGPAVTVCSVDDLGIFNFLGNSAFLRLSISTSQNYTLTMTQSSGLTGRDPDFHISCLGQFEAIAESIDIDMEQLVVTLAPGEYAIRAFDFLNNSAGNTGDSCYAFTVL